MQVTYLDHMGDDLTVVNAARVSFHKESKHLPPTEDNLTPLSEEDQKLIRYLAEHNHWTPFSHPQLSFRVKAPVCIRTQLFKHKVGLTENEISRRYVKDTPEFYFPVFRQAPDKSVKQGSKDEFPANLEFCESLYLRAQRAAESVYNRLIEENVAPEQARMLLPQSMYTEWVWTGSLAAFARVCNLRLDPHAQKEVQEIAKMLAKEIEPLFPYSWKALMNNDKSV